MTIKFGSQEALEIAAKNREKPTPNTERERQRLVKRLDEVVRLIKATRPPEGHELWKEYEDTNINLDSIDMELATDWRSEYEYLLENYCRWQI
jgi:hypothetical protein